MTGTPENTKVAMLTEAFEDFALALSLTVRPGLKSRTQKDVEQTHLATTRTALHDALAGFVKPSLRLIQGGKDQQGLEIITCGLCQGHRRCIDITCSHWAKAIREAVNKPETAGPQINSHGFDGPEAA